LNARDFARRFRDDASDGGKSVNSARGERLEIGLNSGSGAAVGTGDGERDRNFLTI
jgi:hypothetical protein